MGPRPRLVFVPAVALWVVFLSCPCQGATFTWQGASGDWFSGADWNPIGIPAVSDNVLIANGGTVSVTTASQDVCATLTLGGSGSGTVQIVAGGGLTTGGTAGGSEYIGNIGAGVFRQSGGTHSVAAFIYLANGGANGSYSLSGGSLGVFREFVGYSGSGSFAHSGGTNATGNVSLGFTSGVNGSYSLSGGGLLATQDESVGLSGTGSFAQSGGTNSMSNYLILGDGVTGYGSYLLSGNGLLVAPIEYDGDFAGGSFTQSGGTNSVTNMLNLGNNSGVSGSYALNGGLLIVGSGGITKGPGSATFSFGSGTLRAGASFSSSPPMQLTAASVVDTNGSTIGVTGVLSGSGSLLKTGAGVLALSASNTFSGGLTIGAGTVSSVYTLPGTVTFTNDPVLQAASAAFSISSNVVIDANATAVIDTNGYTVVDSGGISGAGGLTKTGAGTLILANASTFSGDTVVSQGTLQVTNAGALQNSNVVVNVDGGLQFNAAPSSGTISVAGLSGSNSVSLTSGGAPIVLAVGGNDADTTFSGALNGSGTLAKVGTGSLYLSGSSSWTGGLTIDPGILAINSDAALGAVPPTPSNNIRFVANATVQARNTLSLSASRNISIAAGATARFDSGGGIFTIAGGISGAGGLAKIGAGTLVLTGNNSYGGDTLVGAGSLIIPFSYSLPDGANLDVGSDVFTPPFPDLPVPSAAAEVSPVPEPATFWLLAVAAAAGLAFGRKNRG